MTVQVTAAHLRAAAKGAVTAQNMMSVLVAVDRYGKELGMDRTHRSVQFYAQIMHESGDFRYDREIWGPTDAQKRYDARVDLGNTPAADGDGKLYMGKHRRRSKDRAGGGRGRSPCLHRLLDPQHRLVAS